MYFVNDPALPRFSPAETTKAEVPCATNATAHAAASELLTMADAFMWSVAEPIWCHCFGKESTPPPTQAEAEAVQIHKDCSICTFSCTFQLCFSRYPRHLNRSRWVVVSMVIVTLCCLPVPCIRMNPQRLSKRGSTRRNTTRTC